MKIQLCHLKNNYNPIKIQLDHDEITIFHG